ncbi:UbiA family prenyltransferase [Kineococcus xinjiangensis]|uniref:UbiA family prenyltransferase n=1 Tax=Kineococcus xinjiangensis TaxID=512762 RepID=UPI001B806883|nr:UbiA family prenyltransferase [Kineococcus xinjiangensis]
MTVTDGAPSPAPLRRGGGWLRALLLSCHPLPTVAVTALATALAAGAGGGVATTALLGSAVLAGQLAVGWSNDWVDAARDAAVGRGDKPAAAGLLPVRDVRAAALAAAAAVVPLSLLLGWRAGLLHLLGVAAALGYNAGLKSTPWSWVPYVLFFGGLPTVVTLAVAGGAAPLWASAVGALLGVGAHCANVIPDLDDDRATGVRGLPHLLGRAGSTVLASAALSAASVLVVLGPPGPPGALGWAGLALAGALTASAAWAALTSPRSRWPFPATVAVAALDVALLVAAGGALTA